MNIKLMYNICQGNNDPVIDMQNCYAMQMQTETPRHFL